MNEYPLVSFIIACYNHEKYVTKTLDSILQDSYPNKEIVIINDGSKDKSDEVIKLWITAKAQQVPVNYISRPNKGICPTLNELLDNAKGKYIVPIASDDMLYGNTTKERVEILESNPSKLVLVSDALVINDDDKIILPSAMENYNHGNKAKYSSEEGIIEETILNPSISGPVVIYNKDIFNIIGKYPENIAAEDWFFYQRAAAKLKILFWDTKVSLYRLHDSNISGQKSKVKGKLVKAIIKTFIINMSWFPGSHFKWLAFKQIRHYTYIYLRFHLFFRN